MIKSSVFSSPLLNVTKSPPFQFATSNAATAYTPSTWSPQPQGLQFRVSSSANHTVEVAPSPANEGEADDVVDSGADIVRKFYQGINDQDLASVEELIAEKCVYEDLVFPRPFVGRKVPNLLSSSQ